jgi:hypothetical protein
MTNAKLFRSKLLKGAVLAFTVVYSILSIGIIKSTHFCMGREASVAFFSADAKKCDCSLFLNDANDCCNDERGLMKIDDDQTHFTGYHISVPQLYILEDLYTEQLMASRGYNAVGESAGEKVDIPQKIPLFKSNCSFVFYDSVA